MNRISPTECADNLVALTVEVEQHLKAGEIDNPTFQSLKYNVDRAIEGVSRAIPEKWLYQGKYEALRKLNNKHLDNLTSAVPVYAIRDLTAFEKKVAKVKLQHAFVDDCLAFICLYKPLAEKFARLRETIVSTSQRRAQAKDRETKVREQKFTEYATLVEVLQQHLDAYVQRAEEIATDSVKAWVKRLAKHKWDAIKAAKPVGLEHVGPRKLREMEQQTFGLFLSLTDSTTDYERYCMRKKSATKEAEFVKRAGEAARASYMGWIYKMIQKIGQPVTAATMTGNPWIQSTIVVTRKDGTVQTWHTQMIVNYSKYGYPFNQFPSRLVKP